MLYQMVVLLGLVSIRQAAVYNIDPNYAPWPNGMVYFTLRSNEYSKLFFSEIIIQIGNRFFNQISGG